MSEFWQRVNDCRHKTLSRDYAVRVSGCTCGDATEVHCLDCRGYITEDPCGEFIGQSGWSHFRWKKRK